MLGVSRSWSSARLNKMFLCARLCGDETKYMCLSESPVRLVMAIVPPLVQTDSSGGGRIIQSKFMTKDKAATSQVSGEGNRPREHATFSNASLTSTTVVNCYNSVFAANLPKKQNTPACSHKTYDRLITTSVTKNLLNLWCPFCEHHVVTVGWPHTPTRNDTCSNLYPVAISTPKIRQVMCSICLFACLVIMLSYTRCRKCRHERIDSSAGYGARYPISTAALWVHTEILCTFFRQIISNNFKFSLFALLLYSSIIHSAYSRAYDAWVLQQHRVVGRAACI